MTRHGSTVLVEDQEYPLISIGGVMPKWRHVEYHPEIGTTCQGCDQEWPCDAEKMRVERDAAIRRASELEAVLAGLVRSVIWMKQGIPPGGSLGSEWGEFLRRTGDVNQWLDQSEAALRSQESQKPPETET